MIFIVKLVRDIQKYKPVEKCFCVTLMSWKHEIKTYSSGSINEDKNRVWRALHVLIFCLSETYFYEDLRRFCIEFQHIPAFATYFNSGWARLNMNWRILWPQFDKIFFIWCYRYNKSCWTTLKFEKIIFSS